MHIIRQSISNLNFTFSFKVMEKEKVSPLKIGLSSLVNTKEFIGVSQMERVRRSFKIVEGLNVCLHDV